MNQIHRLNTSKIVLIILVLGSLVYGNGLVNNFVGDDIPQIVDNTAVHSPANILTFFNGGTFYNGGQLKLSGAYYKPLLMVYFSIVYALGGLNPFAFHLLQLGLHIFSAVVLFLILRNLFNSISAFLCALIFLFHPINSEAVYYISDSQDVLFFCFGILGLWNYMKTSSFKSLCLTGLLLFGSILAKETGLLFFIIVFLYGFIFDRKRILQTFTVLLTVFSGYLLLRINALGGLLAKSDPIAPIEKLDLLHRMMNIPGLVMFYAGKVVFPLNLSYSYNWVRTQITFRDFVLPLFFCLFILGLIIYTGIKLFKRNQKDLLKKYIFFSIWFFVGVALHLQIIPLDVTAAERWFYFPLAGLLGMAIATQKGWGLQISLKNFRWFLAVMVLTLFAIRTGIRSFDFRNEFTLDNHDSQVSTDDYNLENGLASDLLKIGKPEEAKTHALKSIRLNPYWSNFNTLGSIYLSMGDYQNARKAYEKALSYSDYYQIYENLAGLTLAMGKYEDNIKLIKSYIEKFPQHTKLWLYLAINQYLNGNISEAKYSITKSYNFNQSGNPEILAIYNTIMSEKPLILNLKVGITDIPNQ